MVITRTPFRISFFGGGTDYPVWYREHGGAVLATTIDKGCYITCRRCPPFFEYHSRISYSRVENVATNSAIEHPSVRGCLQFLGIEEGVEVHHVADLPARTGLGTSSSFTVGLLLGLYALQDRMRDKQRLAADATHVEQELLGEAVGGQDQVSAACGGLNRINFETDGSVEVKRILTPPSRLAELEQHLALYFTGFSRTASEIAQEQLRVTPHKRRELEAMYQLVSEAESILSSPGRSTRRVRPPAARELADQTDPDPEDHHRRHRRDLRGRPERRRAGGQTAGRRRRWLHAFLCSARSAGRSCVSA